VRDKDESQAEAIEKVDRLLLEGLNSPTELYDKQWLEKLKAGLDKRRRPE